MKKLLIASTALVATAGMASADITISGHAAAGIYSGLGNKNAVATAVPAVAAVADANATGYLNLATDEVPVSAETFSGDGIYSNAGVDFTMTGATDNGISFSASVNIDAGMEVDTGDFELDGKDGGTAGLGSVSMTGAFGTLTFDDGGIENLYSDSLTNADVSYATTIGAVSLTVAHDTAAAVDSANSLSAGYTASGMAFTLTAAEETAGTSTKLAVAYALNDTVSLSGKTNGAAGKDSVQTIGATTTLNGVSVSVESSNNSDWDVDLGYSAGGFTFAYGTDEKDEWAATATTSLGGGASFAAGINYDDEMYAGVSFSF